MSIFSFLFVSFIGIMAILIFIQTLMDLWTDIGNDVWNGMKSKFKTTRVGMWINNRKNRVKILSEYEYEILCKSGMIKQIIIK